MSRQEQDGRDLATKLVTKNWKRQGVSPLGPLERAWPGKHLDFRF